MIEHDVDALAENVGAIRPDPFGNVATFVRAPDGIDADTAAGHALISHEHLAHRLADCPRVGIVERVAIDLEPRRSVVLAAI